jgi:hypothetical protein
MLIKYILSQDLSAIPDASKDGAISFFVAESDICVAAISSGVSWALYYSMICLCPFNQGQ